MRKLLFLALLASMALIQSSTLRKLPGFENANVLVITVDALRADYLGCYGSGKNLTPYLDSLAKTSDVYLEAISQVPMTIPAVYSIFTGDYPPEFSMIGEAYLFSRTAPAVFDSRGYATAAVVGTNVVDRSKGFDKGFSIFYDASDLPTYLDPATVNASTVARQAMEIISGQAGKFFLWLHFKDPHTKYAPPDRFRARRDYAGSQNLSVNDYDWDGYDGIPHYAYEENRTELDYYIDMYGGEIREVDENIGSLLSFMDKKGILNITTVVIVGLHGESLGEDNYYFTHSQALDEANVHVPLIIKKAGQSKGNWIEGMVSIRRLYGFMLGKDNLEKPDEKLFLENVPLYFSQEMETKYPKRYGIRTGNRKLIYDSYNDNYGFYSLDNSSEERLNINGSDFEVLKSLLEQPLPQRELQPGCIRCTMQDIGLKGGILDGLTYYVTDDSWPMMLKSESGEMKVRIKIMKGSPDQVSKYREEMMRSVDQLYQSSGSPYPGIISSKIECSSEFLPVKDRDAELYSLYATERLTYGACSWDLVRYHSYMYYLICQDRLYQIELFLALGRDEDSLKEGLKQVECGFS